jgi:hypothetical protein
MDSFDPQNKKHVEWLKKLTEVNTEEKFKMLKDNPMKSDFLETEMVQVLFGLCAQYAKAVFQKRAVILD